MINYKDFTPVVAYGSNQIYNKGFVLNSCHEPLIIQGTNWEHDLNKEDFTQYDYVELNGVRFNRAKNEAGNC